MLAPVLDEPEDTSLAVEFELVERDLRRKERAGLRPARERDGRRAYVS